MLSTLTGVCVIIAVVWFLWKQRKIYILAWKIGGPSAWPLLGNVAFILDSTNVIKNCMNLCNDFPKWYRLWAGPHLIVFLNQPELVEVVLKSPHALDKGPMYRAFNFIIGGEALFNSAGKVWQSHRKFLKPTLQHYSLLSSFHPVFNRHLKTLVERLDKRVDDGEIDILSVIKRSALEILCETTFGTLRVEDETNNEMLFKTIKDTLEIGGMFFSKPWRHIKPLFWMTRHYKSLKFAQSFGKEYVQKIINQKTREYQSSSLPTTDVESDKKVVHNFIDESLRLSMETKFFTNDDLIYESMSVLYAGFETSALTVSYVLLMLAMHPECQERVFDELHSIFPDQSSDVTSAELHKLQYTNQVIKETLRLFPAVPYITRMSKVDLNVDNVVIPAGCEIVIPILHIHRNKSVWGPNADAFNPDNFLPENIDAKHPYAYLAFSAGPRNCIGNKYGYMSLRFFVCWLVRHYRFSTSMKMEDMQFRFCISLHLSNGHMVKVLRRDKY